MKKSAPYYENFDSEYSWDPSHKYLEIHDAKPDNVAVATPVNNIAVTITAPELGATPDYNPVCASTPENGVKINLDYVYWYKIAASDFTGTYNDNLEMIESDSGEVFTTGYYYFVEMNFYTNVGYKITETTDGTINGKPYCTIYDELYYGNSSDGYLCGMFVPLHEHTSGTEWKSDSNNHWHICTVDGCGVIIEDSKAAHTAGDWITDTEATATTDGTKHKECTVCGYVMENGTIPATGIEHTHNYSSDWKADADEHWNECECGDKANKAAHADENNDGKCDVCDYAMGNVENPGENIESEKDGLSGGAIAGIAVGSVAGAAALGCGGFAIFWFVIKKKKFADLIALFKKK